MTVLLSFLWAILAVSADENHAWFYPKRHEPKAYALLIHGFNLKPSKMDEIASLLNDNQIAVLRLALTGHRGEPHEMQNISVQSYQTDFNQAFQELKSKANRAPLYLVGYSLGGLLSVHEWAKLSLKEIRGAILFAPAIITKKSSRFILKIPFTNLFPSLSKGGWISHRFTSRVGYETLFELQNNVQSMLADELKTTNKPTLVFLKEKDEFIQFDKTNAWIKESQLTEWKVINLPRKENLNLRDSFLDHLMITEETAGIDGWKIIKNEIGRFFRN